MDGGVPGMLATVSFFLAGSFGGSWGSCDRGVPMGGLSTVEARMR